MNSLDATLTCYFVRIGAATEGNPVMAALLRVNEDVFLTFKLLLVNMVIVLIWREGAFYRRPVLALVPLGAYAAIVLLHVYNGYLLIKSI